MSSSHSEPVPNTVAQLPRTAPGGNTESGRRQAVGDTVNVGREDNTPLLLQVRLNDPVANWNPSAATNAHELPSGRVEDAHPPLLEEKAAPSGSPMKHTLPIGLIGLKVGSVPRLPSVHVTVRDPVAS